MVLLEDGVAVREVSLLPRSSFRRSRGKAEPPREVRGRSRGTTAGRGPRRATAEGVPVTATFADLGASRRVIETLAARGVTEPFEIQSLVLGDAIAGKDVLARSATGSG